MTLPDSPYAMVETSSREYTSLLALGWRPTDLQEGWAHMEPPHPPIKVGTWAGFRAACADLIPELHWKTVGAGLGPTCWGYRHEDDPMGSKVAVLTGGSTAHRRPFIAYGVGSDGEAVQLAHVGSFREAARAIREHLGLRG